ncbi:hypothetical protein CEXT_175071 [Caerostris extrusa]|uniref:Uncharacterized protein n=1 Tax=Caerostris extrusa TaxID=172846 RepID=A0AAV4T488_CAEEX|nr:hypothetical protein CEXT_175071 [Caerostris extrusa]
MQTGESELLKTEINEPIIKTTKDSSDFQILRSGIGDSSKLTLNFDASEDAVSKRQRLCKMEEERLKKLTDMPILEIPKLQNTKRQMKQDEGFLLRIFRYLFG